MDVYNDHAVSESRAKAKILIDANVLIYAQRAAQATNVHLLNYLDSLHGTVDWFVAGCVTIMLHNGGTYNLHLFSDNVLNCDAMPTKYADFPYIQANGELGFVTLNNLAGDDWAQIALAHNYPELIIVTNDSAMFKSAHAVLDGRAMGFHDFLQQLSPYWFADKQWLDLKAWFHQNVKPLRNNSSWIIPGKQQTPKNAT